jgi:hypothetical protein
MTVVDFEAARANAVSDWAPISQGLPDVGTVVRLKFRDALGVYSGAGRYFLHDDGEFYLIDPPTRVAATAAYWTHG